MAVPALSSGFEQIPGLASAQLEVAQRFPDPIHALHIPGEQHSSVSLQSTQPPAPHSPGVQQPLKLL